MPCEQGKRDAGGNKNDDRRPYIQAQAQEEMRLIDAKCLDPHAARRIRDDVQHEDLSTTKSETPLREQEQSKDPEVPQ